MIYHFSTSAPSVKDHRCAERSSVGLPRLGLFIFPFRFEHFNCQHVSARNSFFFFFGLPRFRHLFRRDSTINQNEESGSTVGTATADVLNFLNCLRTPLRRNNDNTNQKGKLSFSLTVQIDIVRGRVRTDETSLGK